MMRWPIIALTLICAMSHAAAQDMALSQILIEGEGWKALPRNSTVLPPAEPADVPGLEQPLCAAKSPDGGTLFVGSTGGKYIWAFRSGKDGSRDAGQPYCSLRVPRGQQDMPVTGLCCDAAGRIYAATPLGVQIFDPTGRLCGVLTNPSRDPVIYVHLMDDNLYAATHREFFVRKVKARAPRAQ